MHFLLFAELIFRKHIVIALVLLRDQHIKWPNENERKQNGLEMKNLFNLPNGVGVMDGTLIEMSIAPCFIDASDYD